MPKRERMGVRWRRQEENDYCVPRFWYGSKKKKYVGKKNLLSNDTFTAVLLPWVRTIGTVLAKLHPLATQRTEHTVRLDLRK